jgi:predicted outer membrane repeat protein
MTPYLPCVALLALALPSAAEIIGYDSFNYPDGSISAANGAIHWDYKNTAPTGHSGTKSTWEVFGGPNTAHVSAGKLVTDAADAKREYRGSNEIEGAVNEDNVAKQVYYRVSLVTPGSMLSTVGLSSLDFGDERIFIGVPFGQNKFGIVDNVAGNTAFSATSALANHAYTFVAKIDFANDLISLYVDPNLTQAENLNTPVVTKAYTGTNWSTAVRLVSGGLINPTTWDDLMVATAWDDLKTRFVTTTADAGAGSLRQTIADAPAGSVIRFDPALSGSTITLTGGRIVLNNAVTISSTGLPGGVTISGNHASQIFYVNGPTVTLESLTLRDGQSRDGGGVYCSSGNLTMRGCTVTACSAMYGGAVYSVTNLVDKKTTLINCTLTGNSATQEGGALFNFQGDTELIHCTITGNSAPLAKGGGAASFAGTTRTTVGHSIIAGNPGDDVTLLAGSFMSFFSSGANLIGSGDGSAAFNQPGDLFATDPKLAPLGNCGGPVATMLPLTDSPAIDRLASATLLDQRGFSRGDGIADSGAVERGPLLTVTNTSDSGPGSLRATLAAVTVPDTGIQFAPGLNGQTITLTTGQLFVPATMNVEIDASTLSSGIIISGNQASRVISSQGILGLNRVTLTGGSEVNGAGIDSTTRLFAVDSTFRDNVASNAGGGIVLYGGSMDLLRCTISGNTADDGGGLWQQGATHSALLNCTVSGNLGTGFLGNGGISIMGGTTRITHTTLTGNMSSGLRPGGLYVQSPGTAHLSSCVIAGNTSATNASVDLEASGLSASGPSLIGVNNSVSSVFPTGTLAGTSASPLDARLAPLGNYGGPTRTAPPFHGSPAIGATGTTALVTDQRGINRAGPLTLGAVHDLPAIVTNAGNSGPGSLRDTLTAAFTTTVRFDPAVFNGEPADVIALTSPLGVNRSVGIDGSTATNVTLSGGDAVRLLTVATGQEMHLKSLTLRDGLSGDGGAIRSQGRLTLDQCRVIENQSTGGGGGISSSGNVTLRSCDLSGNTAASFGGAIVFDNAKLQAENCLFAQNHANTGGGGILTFGGSISLTNSILASNTVSGSGGAIWLQNSGASLKLTHCTVTGNSATGITWDPSGNTVTLENSIVAGNGAQNLARAPLQLGNNQITGTPKLAPLGQYGSGFRSMPPLPGSPAIEGGVLLATTPALDFRGAPRPNGALPDLGAVEAFPLGNLGLASNDGDTIPDIFEGPGSPYPHLSTSVNNSAADTDGDGMTDADEIADSTDPLNANSKLRITHFAISSMNPGFTATNIDFTSFPGLSYSAEFSDDLDFSGARVSPLGSANGFLFQTSINMAPTERFVRIRRNP